MERIELKPIGIIHSPFKERSQAPFQGIHSDEPCELEIFPEYVDGLKDIEGFSHLVLLYYAHKSEGFHLQTITPWDSVMHGVFTTCSPFRPNPILLSVVSLLARKGPGTLLVSQLDAINGTPIIDIKPYFPNLLTRTEVRVGWMKNKDIFQKKSKKQ